MRLFVLACVCVCDRERHIQSEKEKDKERKRKKAGKSPITLATAVATSYRIARALDGFLAVFCPLATEEGHFFCGGVAHHKQCDDA